LGGAATARSTSAQGSQALSTAFKAPLLDRILNAEESEQRQVVLDLGGPSQYLLDRLRAVRPVRVEIADLVGTGGLAALRVPEFLETSGPAAVRDYLPAPREPLDLILCWDLPNYLSLPVLRALCAALSERAAPDCQLHMLIAYSRRDMPTAPARYRLGNDGQLVQTCADATLTAAPRYSPEDVNLSVGGFRYELGVLLANGMQEFLSAWPH
jgi:hypothetical protein